MAGIFDDLIQQYGTPQTAVPAPAPAGGMFDDLVAKYSSTGKPPPASQGAPSTASDIADSAASRYQAGLLDIPGLGGDLVSLANNAADAIASPIVGGIRWLEGKPAQTPEEKAASQAKVDARGTPLGFLPTSADIKKDVGFEAYQPQTDVGKTFDKWGGGAIELVPSVLASGGSALIKKGAQAGVGAAVKQGAGDIAKYAAAPAVAGEAAGEATKGTALEPWARLAASVAAGGAAGARGATVDGALSADEWRAVGDQAYRDVKQAGIGVKPAAVDAAINDIQQTLHGAGFDPQLHPKVQVVLNRLEATKGTPQSFEELDRLHRIANGVAKSLEPDERRLGGMLANKIDTFMENLKPSDLTGGGNAGSAFNMLTKGRDAWRRMRTGERIDNMIAKAKDAAGANYTAAGLQTAIKQQFRAFKWKGKAELTPEFNRLSDEEKMLVNGIIGGGNALRLIGKFNFRNPVVAAMMGALGVSSGPTIPAAALAIGEGARALSARGTMAKVDQLGAVIRGGKVTPARRGIPPNAIFYGGASQDQPDGTKYGR